MEGASQTLPGDFSTYSFDLPEYFEVEMKFTDSVSTAPYGVFHKDCHMNVLLFDPTPNETLLLL